MISIHMLKLWWLEIIFKYDIKFSNVLLGSENINFNGFQIFDDRWIIGFIINHITIKWD